MIFSKPPMFGQMSAFGHLFQKRTLCENIYPLTIKADVEIDDSNHSAILDSDTK